MRFKINIFRVFKVNIFYEGNCVIKSKKPPSWNDTLFFDIIANIYALLHTNYIISHCTTLYNYIIIIYDKIFGQKQNFRHKR